MNQQDIQKLNEKIAKWLGFKIFYDDEWDKEHKYPMFIPPGKPKRTHMIDAVRVPWFTDSMDSCIEWIMPKLEEAGIYWSIENYRSGLFRWESVYVCVLKNDAIHFSAEEKTIPLALCSAVEKLIDSEVKR